MHILHHDTAGLARDAIITVIKSIGSFQSRAVVASIEWFYDLQRGAAIKKLNIVVFAGITGGSYCQVAAFDAVFPEPYQQYQE